MHRWLNRWQLVIVSVVHAPRTELTRQNCLVVVMPHHISFTCLLECVCFDVFNFRKISVSLVVGGPFWLFVCYIQRQSVWCLWNHFDTFLPFLERVNLLSTVQLWVNGLLKAHRHRRKRRFISDRFICQKSTNFFGWHIFLFSIDTHFLTIQTIKRTHCPQPSG